jgi:hypothetical protein
VLEVSTKRNASTAPPPQRPLQNRVDPFGEFHAVPTRGAFLGNRGGRLHRPDQTLAGRRWTSRRWIVCVCAFKDRRRSVWGDSYTELFFLDEPTALAAGHRPCFECRRAAAKAFAAAFPGEEKGADAMDAVLHRERLDGRRKGLWRTPLAALPDGAFVTIDGRPHAIRDGKLRRWSFAGYGAATAFEADAEADVLTPPSTVAALAAGYRPVWDLPSNAPA